MLVVMVILLVPGQELTLTLRTALRRFTCRLNECKLCSRRLMMISNMRFRCRWRDSLSASWLHSGTRHNVVASVRVARATVNDVAR